MIDATHAERQLTRMARVRDEELLGVESGLGAQALLAALVAEQAGAATTPSAGTAAPAAWWQRRPAQRLVLATAALATMTVAVVVGPSLVPDGTGSATSYANSAIEIRREGDFFVGRIKDPLADHALYVEAFRAVGKDVDIEFVPVSRGLVGILLQAGGDGSGHVRASSELVSTGPTPVDCRLKPEGCTLVIRISADTTGTVRYKIGRVARPGEAYQDPVVIRGPGGGVTGGPGD